MSSKHSLRSRKDNGCSRGIADRYSEDRWSVPYKRKERAAGGLCHSEMWMYLDVVPCDNPLDLLPSVTEQGAGIREASPTQLGTPDEGDSPFVVRPWPYLRAMFNIAIGAFLHPWKATVVDLETGAVVD